MWRYSIALMSVLSALLDVVWWVPAHPARDGDAARAPVPAEIARCRRAELEQSIAALEAELAREQAELDRLSK